MTNRRICSLGVGLLAAFAAACGGDAPATDADAEAEAPTQPEMRVRILAPDDSATVGTRVHVTFAVTGVAIVPAGTDQPRSGHHHLLINQDIPPSGTPIPSTEGHVHLGQAQTETDLELTPGQYRLIAVVADFAHVPLEPLVVDTVHITVQ